MTSRFGCQCQRAANIGSRVVIAAFYDDSQSILRMAQLLLHVVMTLQFAARKQLFRSRESSRASARDWSRWQVLAARGSAIGQVIGQEARPRAVLIRNLKNITLKGKSTIRSEINLTRSDKCLTHSFVLMFDWIVDFFKTSDAGSLVSSSLTGYRSLPWTSRSAILKIDLESTDVAHQNPRQGLTPCIIK